MGRVRWSGLPGPAAPDGHPHPPSSVLALWSQLAGPGFVTFEDASAPETTATFSAPGEYVLQLVGDDSAAQTSDTVAITVSHTVTLSVTTLGPGTVTLDPPGGSYSADTPVTVTANPAAGAVFRGFSGSLSGTASPQGLVLDGDAAVQAEFRSSGGGPAARGIGPELAAALPLLAWLRRRRARAR